MIYETILKTFKRANKSRRESMAKKYGFDSAKDLLVHLEANVGKEESKLTNEIAPTDIVIAFDTTGSMSSYIGDVKKHVMELIPTLFRETKNLQISIVAFGDYIDMKSNFEFGKAYQVIDLTNNSNDLIEFVQKAKNTSGGDGDEFYGLVLNKIRTETRWRDNSNKSILFIADDEDHPIGRTRDGFDNKHSWKIEAPLLNEANIKVDTLSIHGYTWYKSLSSITRGIYMEFKSSNKTAQLLEGYTYARTGSMEAFATSYSVVEASGDNELLGVYKQLGTL